MFEALKNKRRDAIKASTAWFLFGAIILVFIFWGMNPHHEGFGQGGIAAYVNNEGIPMRHVFRLLENMRQQEPAGDADQEESSRKQRQSQALSQLVTLELVAQATSKAGIAVANAEVRDFLVKQPAFQENGAFKREFYMRYLQATGTTATELETTIRRELLMQKIQRAFGAAIRPNELENKKQRELADTKANLEYLAIPAQGGDLAAVPAAEAKEFAKKEAEKVKAYFDSHQSEFAQAEEAHARHILVKFAPGKPESEKAALEKASQLKERLAKGEDFAKLALAESDDPGSKAKGGDLGFFARGRMVPEFEKTAFEAPLKSVSAPVRSQYGYHLIETLEKKAARSAALDDATRDRIARKLIAEAQAARELEKFQEAAKKGDAKAIDELARASKLKWEESGAFSIEAMAVPKIGANDEIARAAFSLTEAHPLAPTVFRQGPKAYVIRYKAVPPKATASASDKAKKTPGLPDFDNPDFMRELMATQQTRDAMGHWLSDLQKNAKIEYSPNVAER
jgi:peptidyl-prolyl cis-trans isomerase D